MSQSMPPIASSNKVYLLCAVLLVPVVVAAGNSDRTPALDNAKNNEPAEQQTQSDTDYFLVYGASDSEVAAYLNHKHPTKVDLDGSAVTDDGLSVLQQHPEIENLQIDGLEITEKGFRNVASLKNLKVLCANNLPIGDEAAAIIATLPHLQILQLGFTRITDVGLKCLSACKRLDALCLDNCAISDAGLMCLADFAQLKTIVLTKTRITNAGLPYLARASHLNSLFLDGCNITDIGIESLGNLTEIVALSLTDTNAGDESLELVARKFKSSCCSISLGRNTTDAGLPELVKLTNLVHLEIYNTKITDEGLQRNKCSSPLFSLMLGSPGLSDAALACFNTTELNYLKCRGIRRSPGAIRVLANMPKLDSLVLTEASYDATDLDVLQKVPRLKSLELSGKGITDEVIPSLQSLSNVDLNLRGTGISEEKQRLVGGFRGCGP